MPLRVQINTFIIIGLCGLVPVLAVICGVLNGTTTSFGLFCIASAIVWAGIGTYVIYLLIPRWSGWLSRARFLHINEKVVALTFDDGPDREWTSQILDILKLENIPATFFILSDKAVDERETVARIASDGHEIGNHTASHGILTMRGPAFIEKEVRKTNETLEMITGTKPKLFRSPHGFKSPFLGFILKRNGLELIPWTKGIWDTDNAGASVLFERFKKYFESLEIMLLHDGVDHALTSGSRKATVEVLPQIIAEYRRRGYRFVKVGELGAN
jgi:peptidoglycan-N-acetylglucosamine deacetylase